jgi:hypothetical protein
MDHILVASTADIECRPSSSKDMLAPVNRERPKEVSPQKQLLRKRSSSNYPPAKSLDELCSKKKSLRRENVFGDSLSREVSKKNRDSDAYQNDIIRKNDKKADNLNWR